LAILNYAKIFEVEYDAFRVDIDAVLTQEGRPITYLSEKLSHARRKFSTYNKEFHAIIKALEH